MKKITSLIAVGLLLCPSLLSAQQTEVITEQRLVTAETIAPAPYWFGQLRGGVGLTVGENSGSKLMSPAASLAVGYRFNPLFALRADISGWQAKGCWVNPRHDYKYNYVQGNVDAMLSLTNLFCGFNPLRTLDFYALLGVGLNGAFSNNEANDLEAAGIAHFEHLWDGTKLGVAGRGGLGVDIRLSNVVAINLEANANMLSDKWNSKKGFSDNPDWQFNFLAGVTVKFGKSYKVVPAVYEDVVTVVEKPAPAPAPASAPAPVVTKPAPMKQNIFFEINSATIREVEMAKVNELIEYLKKYPEATVQITGYADKDTGTEAYNQKLSERRADTVRAAIMATGINPSRIEEEAKGDTVQPFSVNAENRVVIAIADEK